MSYEKFLENKLIKKIEPDFKQIAVQIRRARKDLRTAEKVMASDRTWSFTITYHAMVRAGKALMYAHGYLPTATRSHKTVVDFTGIVLGDEFDDLFRRFNRMRRRRHDFIYDALNNISETEVKSSIKAAKRFIDRTVQLIAEIHPELRLSL
jgi:uncharacterized protein (UPF0332 family)